MRCPYQPTMRAATMMRLYERVGRKHRSCGKTCSEWSGYAERSHWMEDRSLRGRRPENWHATFCDMPLDLRHSKTPFFDRTAVPNRLRSSNIRHRHRDRDRSDDVTTNPKLIGQRSVGEPSTCRLVVRGGPRGPRFVGTKPLAPTSFPFRPPHGEFSLVARQPQGR